MSLNKIKPQNPKERYLWITCFATDYITVVATKVCTASHEHVMYIRFL